jgi:hypothetical protein
MRQPLRHAAALTLVGWYLMLPPIARLGDHLRPNVDAAISEWEDTDSFDSASQCHDGINDLVRARQTSKFTVESERPLAIWQAQLAKCIASDDPRLKGK